MIEAFSAQDVRAAEEPLLAVERGFAGGLMHRAATALALAVCRELRSRGGRVAGSVVVGLVGPGNNGGDTLHALALLAQRGVRAVAVLTGPAVHDGGLHALRRAGGSVVAVAEAVVRPEGAPDAELPDGQAQRVWLGEALAEAFAADVVLDGLLGIGGRGGLRGTPALLVQLLSELMDQARGEGDLDGDLHGSGPGASGPHLEVPAVIAVDVPSGIGVDDGRVVGAVLTADRTVTFGALKPGLLLPPADRSAGRLELVDLGLAPARGGTAAVRRLRDDDVRRLLPVPGTTAHKYTRGVVGVVAGSRAYPGAAVLAVAGALGTGCGMVRYIGPDEVRAAVLSAHPEVVAGVGRVQSWVLGPGLSEGDEQAAAVEEAFARALEADEPVVVDAGALPALPLRVTPLVVLTPHAGELARLLTARGVEVSREDVDAEPLRWARTAHEVTGATVLLKGATTLVVGAEMVLSQADAPPWLATAGAGDVLAGVLGALLAGRAQEVRRAPALVAEIAAAAALLHGRAAHAANPGGPVRAGAVAEALPEVIARLLGVPAVPDVPVVSRVHRVPAPPARSRGRGAAS